MTIISIGEILWDVFEHAEHLGGAPFNFAAHARRLGHEVFFLSAIGSDERGRRALARAEELGLSTSFIRRINDQATGTVSVKLDALGQPAFTIHRPAAYDFLDLRDGDLAMLSSQCPDWIYFGTLHQMNPQSRKVTEKLLDSIPEARRFYDINLRIDSYTPSLVQNLMAHTNVVKLNEDEVNTVQRMFGTAYRSIEEFCRSYSTLYGWEAACVTRGSKGCAVLIAGDYAEVDGYPVKVADTVGAGDAFAAAFIHGLGNGWSPARVGDFANRIGALVASRPGAIPSWTPEESQALVRAIPE
jgi:fructokinase